MEKIGLVICSYNGCDDTIKCIESLYSQSRKNFDIFVVDNASTDYTMERLVQQFADEVVVLRQKGNLGGAGGFGAGIAHVVSLGYEYIALMDNDIIVDEKAMEMMMTTLEADKSLGAVGAKIMWMSKPDVIYDFSDVIDLEHQKIHSPYRDIYDNERLQGLKETDFVPATAGIFRTKAILEAGSMPVDNFIYYDDVELGWNMYRKGWRMVCCGSAKVWHKSSNANRKHDNFSEYYFQRNTWNFTAKYIAEEKVEPFVDGLLAKTFPILYGCSFKEQWRKFETAFYVFDDFARHVRGKAKEGRIQLFSAGESQVNRALERLCTGKYRSIQVIIEPDAERVYMLKGLLQRIWQAAPQVRFQVMAYKRLDGIEQLPVGEYVLCEEPTLRKDSLKWGIADFYPDLVLHYCGHVKNQRENVLPEIYVDSHYNVVDDERSWRYYQRYDEAFEAFKGMYRPMILEMIEDLRKHIP